MNIVNKYISVPSRASGTNYTVAEALVVAEALEATDEEIAKYCKELGIDTPF
jgi:hypothetical protein